jgi:hypothetical protein
LVHTTLLFCCCGKHMMYSFDQVVDHISPVMLGCLSILFEPSSPFATYSLSKKHRLN